jgi:SAM-dependent methyltransferase
MIKYIPEVRDQYEEFPYPPCNPDDEKTRLVMTWSDDLALVNHYCYAGRQTYRKGFRALVAGGGTGDAAIYLAEQLRHTDAEIVYLDFSRASMEVARRRAQIRGLNNIAWVNESLLALPELGLGKFDYINCIGVLHHLQDPDAGLLALLAVLHDAGALSVMVYGQYGRTGVYQLQELLRLLDPPETGGDARSRLDVAKEVLTALPVTNWFKRGEELITDHRRHGDAGIYDLLLHARDRAYTVGELFAWIHDRRGLHMTMLGGARGRAAYLPNMVIGPERLRFLDRLRNLPLRRQNEIAELLCGNMIMHSFYATRAPDTAAPYGDADCVPFFFYDTTAAGIAVGAASNPGKSLAVNLAELGIRATVNPGRFGGHVLAQIDGKSTFGEIFSRIRSRIVAPDVALTDTELFADFRELFEFLNTIDRVLLRHRSVEPVSEHCSIV